MQIDRQCHFRINPYNFTSSHQISIPLVSVEALLVMVHNYSVLLYILPFQSINQAYTTMHIDE